MSFLKQVLGVVAGIIVGLVVLPFAILVRSFYLLFGLDKDRTPQAVAANLKGILADEDPDGHWDDLDSVPIKEPNLEAIRKEALTISVPLDEAGRATLIALLARAETLGVRRP